MDDRFYAACWRELKSFLDEVIRDDPEARTAAQDMRDLMRSVAEKNRMAKNRD